MSQHKKTITVPHITDRYVRLRAIEDIIEELSDEFKGTEASGEIQFQITAIFLPKKATDPKENVGTAPTAVDLKPNASPAPSNSTVYGDSGKLNAPYLLKNAKLLIEAGDFTLAKNIYSSLLKESTEVAQAHAGLATVCEKTAQWQQAVDHWEEAIAFDPNTAWLESYATTLSKLNRFVQSAEVYERALRKEGLTPEVRFRLHKGAAIQWIKTDRSSNAHSHMEECLKAGPTPSQVRELRLLKASLALKIGRPEIAKLEFQTLIEQDPQNTSLILGYGQALLACGDARSAHDAFANILNLDPAHSTAIFQLTKAAFELKSYATATRCLEEYLKVTKVRDKHLLYSLAVMQFHLGRNEDCNNTLQQLMALWPEHSGAKELMNLSRRTDGSRHGQTQGVSRV